MLRRLLLTLSLFLALSSVGLWAASYASSLWLARASPGQELSLHANSGWLCLSILNDHSARVRGGRWVFERWPPHPHETPVYGSAALGSTLRRMWVRVPF